MGEGELDRMCEDRNRDWLRARAVADAVLISSGGSVADSDPHPAADSDAARPDADTRRAASPWPEPYDAADSDTGSINNGLDRLADHGRGSSGLGRVDPSQCLDRPRGDVPSDGREPVRGADREAAVTTVSIAPNGPIRRERDELREELETSRAANARLIELEAKLIDERDHLREQLRVRDARVEPPRKPYPASDYMGTGDGSRWLVWHEYRWVPSQTYALGVGRFGWLALGVDIEDRPYYRPMPPAPEGK